MMGWEDHHYGDIYDESYQHEDEDECWIGTLIHTTDKAILFEVKRGRFWCPKSMCSWTADSIRFRPWFVPTFLPKEKQPVNHDDAFGEVK